MKVFAVDATRVEPKQRKHNKRTVNWVHKAYRCQEFFTEVVEDWVTGVWLKVSSDKRPIKRCTIKPHPRKEITTICCTTGPRPLVTRSAKLFVNLLLITTITFISFIRKDLKISDSSLVFCLLCKCYSSYWLQNSTENLNFPGKNFQIHTAAGANLN
jgi:hypothetical protein